MSENRFLLPPLDAIVAYMNERLERESWGSWTKHISHEVQARRESYA